MNETLMKHRAMYRCPQQPYYSVVTSFDQSIFNIIPIQNYFLSKSDTYNVIYSVMSFASRDDNVFSLEITYNSIESVH